MVQRPSRQIARAVVREACEVDEVLLKFVGASRRRTSQIASQVAGI